MGLLDSLLARVGYAKAEKAGGVSIGQLFGSRPGQYYSTLTEQKQQINAYLDWVYGAVKTIAEDVATIDFKLYVNRTSTKNLSIAQRMALYPRSLDYLRKQTVRIKTKDFMGRPVVKEAPTVEEIDNHPLLDLLSNPNPFMTKDEFMELTVLHMELAGEAFWAKIRNKLGTPVELWPLMPYLVKVIPDSKKFIAYYTYLVPNGGELDILPQDIVHFKYSNPAQLYRGMSPISAMARAVDTDAHAADYNRKFFYNGAIPDATLQTDQNLSDATYKRLKDEWQSTYGSTSNAHKIAILEDGLKFNMTSATQKDMEFLTGRNFNRDQILALYRVSKSILGLIEDSNRANMEAADYNHAKRVTKPKMLRISNRITSDTAPDFDSKLIVGFTDPVPEDKEFALKMKEAAVNAWMTIDEVRELEGMEELPDGHGAQLYVSSLLVPIGNVAEKPVPGEGADDLEDMNRPQDLDKDDDDSDSNEVDEQGESNNVDENSKSLKSKKKVYTTVRTPANK